MAQGAASQFRALAGIDLMALDPALPLAQRGDDLGEMNQSDVRKYLPRAGERAMTVREILDDLKGAKLGSWTITGDGDDVVNAMEEIVAATDIDGFMLQPSLDIAELRRFVTFVLPVMQSRGYRPDGSSGPDTFRARLGGGDRLKPTHPGAAYRRLVAREAGGRHRAPPRACVMPWSSIICPSVRAGRRRRDPAHARSSSPTGD